MFWPCLICLGGRYRDFLHLVPVLGQNGPELLALWCFEAVIKL